MTARFPLWALRDALPSSPFGGGELYVPFDDASGQHFEMGYER